MRFLKSHWLLRGCFLVAGLTLSTSSQGDEFWLSLKTDSLKVGVAEDLSLAIYHGESADLAWKTIPPTAVIHVTGPEGKTTSKMVHFGDAGQRIVETFDDGNFKGHLIQLGDIGGTNVKLSFVLAVDSDDQLLVEVKQTGGDDAVHEVSDLYTFSVRPDPNSYVIVPRGSGYAIRSDAKTSVSLSGLVGAAYSLPLFAMVQGDHVLYKIVETWWDAQVRVEHVAGEQTQLALDWKASLGTLNYARRALIVFRHKIDHVAIAKAYRKYLLDRGQLVTLKQRLKTTPPLKRFLAGVEYRYLKWDSGQNEQVLENIRRFQKAGLPVTFFHPKWPAQGRTLAGWQEYLRDEPVEGSWPEALKLLDEVHRLGCPAVFFVMPHAYHENAPGYDPSKLSGVAFPKFSDRYTLSALQAMLDNLHEKGMKFEVLYFDGSSAHSGHQEHQSAEGPVSRRETYEAQVSCFRETRRRGIVPGAELARFWCINDCDYFFFTDWSSDRLRDGEPLPFVQLVFHDCYAAHFSGGGYYDEGRYDWYEDRHPRLYELMYGAIPSHNWLPDGSRLIEPGDWQSEAMERRLNWLRRWHAYFQAICFSEMTSHRYLNQDRSLQRVEYANGVTADFDLAKGQFRVEGVAGFTGDWETPDIIERK